MNRTVLVVGGAGYIGSHMVRALLGARFGPVVFDNLSTGRRALVPRGVPLVRGDLREDRDLRALFQKYRPACVMHFAASCLAGESVQQPLTYYENNVGGGTRLVRAMVDAKVRCLIFSSTCAVYGEPDRLPIDETAPTRPVNPYGESKLAVEHLLRDVSRIGRLRYASLRYFNACGAHPRAETGEWHEPETHLIPNALKAALGRKRQLVIFGEDYDTPDGTCIRDYVHVEDLCRAHLLALQALRRGAGSDVFNLGNGSGYSVKDIVRTVEEVTGRTVKVTIGPRRPGDPARLVASADKARSTLGWRPELGLADIVRTAWEWEKRLAWLTAR